MPATRINFPLPPGSVEMLVCKVTPATIAVAEDHTRLLSADEADRAARFRFDADRDAFRLSHILLRARLAILTGRSDWTFILKPRSKPALPLANGPEFNLSHCREMVACGFAADGDVGVDVEPRYSRPDLMTLARAQFSVLEIAALERCPDAERPALFTAIWAGKEAVVKATGLGLHADLTAFSVLDTTRPPTFADPGEDARWTLDRREIGTVHAACAARVGRAVDAAPAVVWRTIDAAALIRILEFVAD